MITSLSVSLRHIIVSLNNFVNMFLCLNSTFVLTFFCYGDILWTKTRRR
uniref:Uncharacterized protein n=1 Tax=Siphoviridae sp. ctAjZ17 TaxID=2827797 RepID=A0A8S5SP58_9CAUD|nr:MAG TPA: hypothetical protein [Siphoviridae sp. ctAjZ17]